MKMPLLIWLMANKKNFKMSLCYRVLDLPSALHSKHRHHRQNRDEDDEHSIFQRRATKPMMLWTTSKESVAARTVRSEEQPLKITTSPTLSLPPGTTILPQTIPDELSRSSKQAYKQKTSDRMQQQRQRNGMSLQEYLAKARAN